MLVTKFLAISIFLALSLHEPDRENPTWGDVLDGFSVIFLTMFVKLAPYTNMITAGL